MNCHRGINYMEGFKMERQRSWNLVWFGIGIGVAICIGLLLLVNWSS